MGKYYIDSKDLFETKLAEFLAENEYHKSRRRAFRRKKNFAKAIRKKKISANVGGSKFEHTHQYSKNKIHCSCPLCAFSGLTHSDLMRLACMESRLRDYKNEVESDGENHEQKYGLQRRV